MLRVMIRMEWPKTADGRRAMLLVGMAIGCAIFAQAMAGIWFGLLEEPGGDIESPPLPMIIPMLAAVVIGAGLAVWSGFHVVRAWRAGDRALPLVVPILATAIVVFFLIGEFAVPH